MGSRLLGTPSAADSRTARSRGARELREAASVPGIGVRSQRAATSGAAPGRGAASAPGVAVRPDLRPLPRAFFARDTVTVARDLIGTFLVHRTPEGLCAGRIVETEAYRGPDDPASHARTRTARSAIMWGTPGTAYVYLIYGMHCCLNVVTEREGTPGAVLIRAVAPVEGMGLMRRRRGTDRDRRLAGGPGRLTRAFGITLAHNGCDLTRGPLFIGRDAEATEPPTGVVATPRIGVIAAKERLWRFCLQDHPDVSR